MAFISFLRPAILHLMPDLFGLADICPGPLSTEKEALTMLLYSRFRTSRQHMVQVLAAKCCPEE
jgi:hypothetical protein